MMGHVVISTLLRGICQLTLGMNPLYIASLPSRLAFFVMSRHHREGIYARRPTRY